ncbi:hypothetical protein Golomagni_01563 [Golovinomyces magnicellulatus]|nr:hypothetical protein Golomagni_01563 [Golovinomyces magnicellulatus]
MESKLHQVWEGAAANPFYPLIGKNNQLLMGLTLLITGLLLTGFFGLSKHKIFHSKSKAAETPTADRSAVNIPLIGIPASLAAAFGFVYIFCAVGVYV